MAFYPGITPEYLACALRVAVSFSLEEIRASPSRANLDNWQRNQKETLQSRNAPDPTRDFHDPRVPASRNPLLPPPILHRRVSLRL